MDALTDAELVHRLKLVKEHGVVGAARQLGIHERRMHESMARAKAKGLTAESQMVTELEKVRAKLLVAERELAAIRRDNLRAHEVKESLYGLKRALDAVETPRWCREVPKSSPTSRPGVPIAFWSDWHWGEVVDNAQVGGVNTFNRKIALARVQTLIKSTIDLAKHHMTHPQYPGIVVALGGDFISGDIHEELRESNEGAVLQSCLEVETALLGSLLAMADAFGQVFVPCVVGNHARTTHKPRAKGRVFTSYEWNIYQHLRLRLHGDRRFVFSIPDETDAHFTVLGHRFMLTHGDALGVKGGDGIIGALGPIARGTMKVGRSEAQIGRDFDTLMIGHWHTWMPRGDGVPVWVNGALKGYDEYARVILRVPYARPSQSLMFVHPTRGVTAQWPVYLEDLAKSSDTARWVTFEERRKAA